MGFNESIIEDLEKVFFNSNELAESCSWNKSIITAIIDDDDLIKKYSSEFETLTQGSHLIFVSRSQFANQPHENDAVNFNHDLYTIDEIKTETGMYVIFLNRGRG